MFKSLHFGLLLTPVLLFSLGYISLVSASPDKAYTHLLFFLVGYALFLIVSAIDYNIYKYYYKYLFIIMFGILVVTFLGGEIKFGSSSWLRIGNFVLQPAEFAKIVEILILAILISTTKNIFTSYKETIKVIGLVLILCTLVLVQPDFGTALVMFSVLGIMLLYAGLNKIYFLVGISVFGIFSNPLWNLLQDYQKKRILVFFNPTLDVLGSGYNVTQALIAVGSGRLVGKGFGMGTQSHLGYLPVFWTDFIFAAFSEEWGFVGVLLLLCLYALLLFFLLRITLEAKSTMGSLLAIGAFAVYFTQFVINIGMNLGVMPVTGLPLPFISYGGSSMLASFILLGLAHSVWRNNQNL